MSNPNTTTAPATFIVGETYSTGGADYVWTFTVIARTAKFITIAAPYAAESGSVPGKRVAVFTGYAGHEAALPLGRYSMAPVISADRPVEADEYEDGILVLDVDDTVGTAGEENYDELAPMTEAEVAELRSARIVATIGTDAILAKAGVVAVTELTAVGIAAAAEEAARQANRTEVARLAELVGAGQ